MTLRTQRLCGEDEAREASMAVQVLRRRFTVDEYYRMAEAGILHEDVTLFLKQPGRQLRIEIIHLAAEGLNRYF